MDGMAVVGWPGRICFQWVVETELDETALCGTRPLPRSITVPTCAMEATAVQPLRGCHLDRYEVGDFGAALAAALRRWTTPVLAFA